LDSPLNYLRFEARLTALRTTVSPLNLSIIAGKMRQASCPSKGARGVKFIAAMTIFMYPRKITIGPKKSDSFPGRAAAVQKSDADGTYFIPETARYDSMPDFVNDYDRHIVDKARDCQQPVLNCQHEQQPHCDENMLMDVDGSAKNSQRMESQPRTGDHPIQLLIWQQNVD
jgi:hypothetical protein